MSWQTAADTRLANGLRIVVLTADTAPVVESRLVLTAGSDLDAAVLVHQMNVAAARTVPGLTVSAEPVGDLPLLLASSVPESFEDVMRAFADVLAAPRQSVLPERALTPGTRHRLRQDVLRRRFTGRSAVPAGRPWTANIGPRASLLIVAGKIDATTAIRAASRHLGTAAADAMVVAPARGQARRSVPPPWTVADPAAPYATVLAAAPAPYPGEPGFAAVLLAAELVGSGPNARLHHALSRRYPAVLNATCTVEHDAAGAWLALEVDVIGTPTDVLAEAALHDLGTAVRRPPTPAEWATAQAGAFRSTVAAQAGTAQTATACAQAAAYGLPPTFWLTVPQQLAHLDTAEVMAAARHYLTPEQFATAATGLSSQLHPCEGTRR